MDSFLEGLLKSSTQANQDRRAQASDTTLNLIDRTFLRLYSQVDPVEASAIRQIQHREAPIDRA